MKRAAYLLATLFALACKAALAAPEDVTCTASAPTINFGSFDILAGTVLDAAGSFTVTCTHNKNSTITVNYSAQLATTPTRQMAPPAGTDRVTYQLYADSARTQQWGDGTGATFTINGTVTMNGSVSVTDTAKNFYGRITPGGQDVSAVSPGPAPTTYSQTLTITVSCTPVPPC
jgi:spore coat protein U domain-containing protein, fimbrial subunit CupE1/2/3/6